jgi:ABC-type sugar transport system ATPase subunit
MEHPVNMFIAGFLGVPPMALLSGGFISGNKLVLDDALIPLPKLVSSLVQNGQAVTLGVRPEAVHISPGSTSPNRIQLRGKVESFESDYVHHKQTVHIHTGHWRYSGVCPLETRLWIGQSVEAQIDPEQLYFFDTNSGLRI